MRDFYVQSVRDLAVTNGDARDIRGVSKGGIALGVVEVA